MKTLPVLLSTAVLLVVSCKKAPEPEGDFKCQKTGQMGTQLPRPPFRNELGKWIQDNILNKIQGFLVGSL